MDVTGSAGPYQSVDAQALAVAVFKDEKADEGILKDLDDLTGGLVNSVLDSGELKGKEGETSYLLIAGKDPGLGRVLLVGVGDRADYTLAGVSQFAGSAVRTLRSKNLKSVALAPRFDSQPTDVASAAAGAAINGSARKPSPKIAANMFMSNSGRSSPASRLAATSA